MTFNVISWTFVRPNIVKLFCQCRKCRDVAVVAAKLTPMGANTQKWTENIDGKYVNIQSVFPPPSKPIAPPGTPGEVEVHFIEGLKVLSVDAYHSAANSFRRTLEQATIHLLGELGNDAEKHKDEDLYSRIKALQKYSLITPPLYDWAEIIRKVGNKGTHADSEFSKEDAIELKNFTEMFLVQVFTMPEKVRKMRASTSKNTEEDSSINHVR